MSEKTELSESVAKSNPDRISEIQNLVEREVHLAAALVSANKGEVPSTRRKASELSADGGYAHNLSFLSVSDATGTYPDTGESGDTYEVELSSPVKKVRLVVPLGEYSE